LAAFCQKVNALAGRTVTQARDIFDLHILDTQIDSASLKKTVIDPVMLRKAIDNIYTIDFPVFRDTVAEYLTGDDRRQYDSLERWDSIRLAMAHRLESLL
jgi:hypothetical protein